MFKISRPFFFPSTLPRRQTSFPLRRTTPHGVVRRLSPALNPQLLVARARPQRFHRYKFVQSRFHIFLSNFHQPFFLVLRSFLGSPNTYLDERGGLATAVRRLSRSCPFVAIRPLSLPVAVPSPSGTRSLPGLRAA